jgi:general secretion pathway protein M
MTSLSAFQFLPPALIKRLRRVPYADLQVVTALLARLSPREQRLVSAASLASVGTLFYLFVIDPLAEAHDRLCVRVVAKERELSEVVALSRAHRMLRQEAARIRSATTSNVSPVAVLESLVSGTVGRDKVAGITPAGRETRAGVEQETLELTLQGVSLRELVELLYKIDTASTTFRTIRLSIKKRYKDPYTFDVALTAVAINTR